MMFFSYFLLQNLDRGTALGYSNPNQTHTFTKRYSIIDQHLARHFRKIGAGLLSLPPFLCSQIITPFSHLMLSSNQERGL